MSKKDPFERARKIRKGELDMEEIEVREVLGKPKRRTKKRNNI